MENNEFIIKKKNNKSEFFGISVINSQQFDSNEKLIIMGIDYQKMQITDKTPPLLFMRVSKIDSGIYSRFRENIWYFTNNYKCEKSTLTIFDYEEHKDIWEWIEKRINPLAITIATILSTLITLIGVNINTYIIRNNEEIKITKLQNELKELQIIIKNSGKTP